MLRHAKLSRRDSFRALGAAAVAGAFGWGASSSSADSDTPRHVRQRAIRIAHLTDVHVQPEKRAAQGMAAALHHVQQLADKPELIVFGGDAIMDCYEADDARTALQWDLWHNVLRNECSIPVRACVGNHDIWGWAKSKSKTTGQEPNWGKRRATEMLRLDRPYYAFPAAGWHVVVLDSTQPAPDGSEDYCAYLDDAQYDWLDATLDALPGETPVLIVSHIPIFSAAVFLFDAKPQSDFSIPAEFMHTDCVKLKDLFARHANVKLCLSGHLHLVDRIDYNGVTYLCNGAVSGNWWKGRHKDCDEGYAVVDLYDDGSFDRQYIPYGWKAEG